MTSIILYFISLLISNFFSFINKLCTTEKLVQMKHFSIINIINNFFNINFIINFNSYCYFDFFKIKQMTNRNFLKLI